MILVIGGAYQGKLSFVKKEFNIYKDEIYYCLDDKDFIDFDKKAIYRFDLFVFAMIKKERDPVLYVKENIDKFRQKIVICEDISCGIVPVEYDMRVLREKVGKCLSIISKNSDRVVRLFCGIPMDLK